MIMVETIGKKLQGARARRKLSLEDASRATKIRSRQLADLERDEYSNFPNLAYAKGFLISYGKYLDVDVRPYLAAFEDANSFGLDNYQYLSDVPLGVYRANRRPTRRKTGRKRYAVIATVLGVIGLGFLSWQLYVSYQRLGDLDKLAEHQEALAQGADTPKACASSAVAPILNDTAPANATATSLAAGTDFSMHYARPTGLPLPNDGGAVRQMLPETSQAQSPFLMYGNAILPDAEADSRAGERSSWSPENLEGYRFYVRSLDRNSVEIFRTGIPRPETVLNKPL